MTGFGHSAAQIEGYGDSMFKKIMIAAAVLTAGLSQTAQAESGWPVCDYTDTQTVTWAGIGEDVIVRTEITSDGEDYPRGKVFLTFEDGQEIPVGDGGKYVDEAGIGCDVQAAEANAELIDSIQTGVDLYGTSFTRLRDFDAALQKVEYCDTGENMDFYKTGPGAEYVTVLRKGDSWASAYADCSAIMRNAVEMSENINMLDKKVYDDLVANDALLITVPYSSYGVDIVVLDRTNGKIHTLFYSGC